MTKEAGMAVLRRHGAVKKIREMGRGRLTATSRHTEIRVG
jgi:hypothetical protein